MPFLSSLSFPFFSDMKNLTGYSLARIDSIALKREGLNTIWAKRSKGSVYIVAMEHVSTLPCLWIARLESKVQRSDRFDGFVT